MSLLPGNGSVTYDGKLAMDIIVRPALVQGNIGDYFKIVPGVKERQQVVFINPLNYVTIKDPGCGGGITPALATRSEKFWSPDPMKAWVQQCYADLAGTIYEQDLNSGDERSNLDGTLAAKHLLMLLEGAYQRDLMRLAFLGKKTIVAGELTGGSGSVKNYNSTDGILFKIRTAVSGGLTPRVTITENAAAAGSQGVTPAAALAYLDSVWYGASPVLKQVDPKDKVIYVTRGIYEGYERYLRSVAALESSYAKLQNGQTALTFNGVELKILNAVDQFLAADFTLTGKITDPNWIICTVKDNLQLGIDAPSIDSMALRLFEDPTTELYNARLKYLMATMIGLEEYVSVGF